MPPPGPRAERVNALVESLRAMPPGASALLLLYFGVVSALGVLGLHRLSLALTLVRGRSRATPLPAPLADEHCPGVLVQLPIFNERSVV